MTATLFIATSLDGVIAQEQGEPDWLAGTDGVGQPGFRYSAR